MTSWKESVHHISQVLRIKMHIKYARIYVTMNLICRLTNKVINYLSERTHHISQAIVYRILSALHTSPIFSDVYSDRNVQRCTLIKSGTNGTCAKFIPYESGIMRRLFGQKWTFFKLLQSQLGHKWPWKCAHTIQVRHNVPRTTVNTLSSYKSGEGVPCTKVYIIVYANCTVYIRDIPYLECALFWPPFL